MYSILAALQMRFKTITTPSSEYLCNIHFRPYVTSHINFNSLLISSIRLKFFRKTECFLMKRLFIGTYKIVTSSSVIPSLFRIGSHCNILFYRNSFCDGILWYCGTDILNTEILHDMMVFA
jgi:hypothetical protein